MLMAKSPDARLIRASLTLAGHSLRVERAAQAIFAAIGPHLRESFALEDQEYERLVRLTSVAALLHDIGKATASFQAAVTAGSRERHPWRHEFLSAAALCSGQQLQSWLSRWLTPGELALVSMMVAGHHLRAQKGMDNPRVPRDETLWLGSHDLLEVWTRAAALIGSDSLPTPVDTTFSHDEGADLINDYIYRSADANAISRPGVLSVGKALVIAADIVGSAHAGEQPIEEWVPHVLSGGLDERTLQSVIQARLGEGKIREFQRAVAASTDRVTVVTAGCGNGKTIAAYLWAKRHAIGRRLAFCYPTTGTSTAGFADYLLAQSDLERRLLHSRAEVDVQAFEHAPDDDDRDLWAPEVLDRWSAHVVACTADTALGLIVNWRTALASLPLWTKSAFVFDEVHSYDHKLFGALLSFLHTVRAPILLMSASLTQSRLRALGSVLAEPVQPIGGDPAIEAAPRYTICETGPDEAFAEVTAAAQRGEKVLVVANTVSRAQHLYRNLRGKLGRYRVFVYHSRFRYEDRVNRQRDVINAFRGAGGVVVVATQVCEMSLDLSADLLVTELPPFPSLLQRLGRLNRHPAIPAAPKRCLWFMPEQPRPYSQTELDQCRDHLTTLPRRALSQSELAMALEAIDEPEFELRRCAFHAQTWETYEEPLRSTSLGWTVVRAEDLPIDLGRVTRGDVIRNEIGMQPKRGTKGIPDWPRLRGVLVAPAGQVRYDIEEGASWAA